jgi:hypothetical protein
MVFPWVQRFTPLSSRGTTPRRPARCHSERRRDVTIAWHDVRHHGDVLEAAVTYDIGGGTWTQRFTAEVLDDHHSSRRASRSSNLTFQRARGSSPPST